MQDIIDRCRVTIPDEVYEVVQSFIDQYLEEDSFGAIYSRKDRGNYDLSKYELMEIDCPNPEVGENHVMWFKLKTIYESIAEEHIRPYLI